MITHRDRLIVLNFMTSPPPVSNLTFSPTSHSFLSTSANSEDLTSLPVNKGTKDLIISSFMDESGEFLFRIPLGKK